MSFIGSERRIDKVIQHAADIFNNGSRIGMPKVFILISGGDKPSGVIKQDLLNAVRSLKDTSSKIYVLNVDNPSATKQLLSVVEKPRDVIPIKSFDILPLLSSSIARQVAKSTSMTV